MDDPVGASRNVDFLYIISENPGGNAIWGSRGVGGGNFSCEYYRKNSRKGYATIDPWPPYHSMKNGDSWKQVDRLQDGCACEEQYKWVKGGHSGDVGK